MRGIVYLVVAVLLVVSINTQNEEKYLEETFNQEHEQNFLGTEETYDLTFLEDGTPHLVGSGAIVDPGQDTSTKGFTNLVNAFLGTVGKVKLVLDNLKTSRSSEIKEIISSK